MLDVKATEDLWKKLINLWEDQTVLIVEHKVEHIWQHVDRVLLLNYDGEIVADDTPEQILDHYEALLTEYGVWHPRAWHSAPRPIHYLIKQRTSYFILTTGKLLEVKDTFHPRSLNCIQVNG